ncbi:MAG: hypothetical protein PVH61_13465, partial [Candidatus Aminicenantes bacterium]
TQPKEYFFIYHRKSSYKSIFPIILRVYSAQKYVFARFLGFTSIFMYDLIISYRRVCRVWMRGVAREIRKVLKMRKWKMFEKMMQAARARAYSWMNGSLT